jgi:hypothetical protein
MISILGCVFKIYKIQRKIVTVKFFLGRDCLKLSTEYHHDIMILLVKENRYPLNKYHTIFSLLF